MFIAEWLGGGLMPDGEVACPLCGHAMHPCCVKLPEDGFVPCLICYECDGEKHMPKNSKVGRCYDKLVKEGKAKGSAAAICQSSTKESLATGKKPKGKSKK